MASFVTVRASALRVGDTLSGAWGGFRISHVSQFLREGERYVLALGSPEDARQVAVMRVVTAVEVFR